MRRLFFSLFVCLSLLVITPQTASAHGPKLKGRLITHPMTIGDHTGNCHCDWRWYTVGFAPGTATVIATLKSAGVAKTPTYAIQVSFMQGGNLLGSARVGCAGSQQRCNKTIRLTHRVSKQAVFYVLVYGLGAPSITYTVGVEGNIVPLHCGRRYC